MKGRDKIKQENTHTQKSDFTKQNKMLLTPLIIQSLSIPAFFTALTTFILKTQNQVQLLNLLVEGHHS